MNKKMIRTMIIVLFLLSIPSCVFADTASDIGSIDGAKQLVNFFDVCIRGVGALILMIGCGEVFLTMAVENIEHRMKGLKVICAGLFFICSYSIICTICDVGNYDGFQIVLSIVALFLTFIGTMFTMYGAYSYINSFRDQNGEARQKSLKIFFGGLVMIAVAQSYSSFLL